LSPGGQRLALNFALRSSRDTACLKYLILLLEIVNGRRCGIKPTELTVSLFEGGKVQGKFDAKTRNVPDTEELDINVDREGLLES
jgi:hypothetical protein